MNESRFCARAIIRFACLLPLAVPGGGLWAKTPSESGTPDSFRNPNLPLDTRVDALVSQLTLEEKVGQMLYEAPAIDRLGIPAYNWWNEALHGVARAGRATVFPQAIGLAAMWDEDMMLRVATAIADEARAKHHEAVRHGQRGIYEGLTFWSPNINIFRDPRWGRGMETYGEDPYLTARLGVAFVRGLQGDHPRYLKTVATPKHFAVHSGPEPERHTFDAVVDERDLRETYLPAFRATVLEAKARSVMCAYNRFRGAPCCGSNELLRRILREEWGFNGYVVSDCGAIDDISERHRVVATKAEASALAVLSGTDLNCGTAYRSLLDAVQRGLIMEEAITTSVKRLFRARFELGMFDPPELVPYAGIPYSMNDSPEHRGLALDAARKSIVLLKNEGGLLPFSPSLRTIAVIGPNADDVETLLGNYNGVPTDPVTPLRGIRERADGKTTIVFARGCDVADQMPSMQVVPQEVLTPGREADGERGLAAAYFNNRELQGKPHIVRTDAAVNFNWWDAPPIAGIRPDSFSVRWSGFLLPPVTGEYALGIRVFGNARLFLDDSLLVDVTARHTVHTRSVRSSLATGRRYALRLEYSDRRPDAVVQLVWSRPEPELRQAALAAARSADLVIAVMGLSPRLEGEEMDVPVPGFAGGDRVEIGLPAVQETLLRDLVATGKPVVLVLLNGSALAVPWAVEHVPAMVEAWYPGQAAGTAIADVLFGDYNPSGRLPVTFYRSLDQLPPFSEYAMNERTYRYFTGEPLFPFGHGLSYTRFTYDNLTLPESVVAGESVQVSVDVTNAGAVVGDEVVQLYLSRRGASTTVPIRSLEGFRRIMMQPGERRSVSFTLEPRQFSLITAAGMRVIEPGEFHLSIGGKQPGFRGFADSPSTQVLSGTLVVTGPAKEIREQR